MTTIRYFIPEDGDEEAYPNVFLAAKSRHAGVPPTLGQIRDAFPLPGRYHFRFKSPLFPGGDRDKDAMAVWMDCVKDNAPVPTWRNTIVAKVTRVGMEEEDDEDDDDFVNAGAPAPPPISHSHSAPTRNHSATRTAPPPQQHAQPSQSAPAQQEPSLDIFGTPAPSNPSSMPISAPPSTGNLLDGHHPAPAPSSGGLLDMDAPVYGSQTANANMHSDFLGMTATPVGATNNQTPGYNPNSSQAYGQQQQQQQQPQQQQVRQSNQNAFGNFSDQQGPFGGLGTPWK